MRTSRVHTKNTRLKRAIKQLHQTTHDCWPGQSCSKSLRLLFALMYEPFSENCPADRRASGADRVVNTHRLGQEKRYMSERTKCYRLQVADSLYRFIEEEALPGTGIDSDTFWRGFDAIVHEMGPKNRALLAERERLQEELDNWHRLNPGPVKDMSAYKAFLNEIGYLVPVPANVRIDPTNIDTEVSTQGGPQLVVPLTNARYVLNAVNARWASLYDALYGTDAISEEDGATRGNAYNPVRGRKVIAFARKQLDEFIPLVSDSHLNAVRYYVKDKKLAVVLKDGSETTLKQPEWLAGYTGDAENPASLLFRQNYMHIDLQFDKNDPISKDDPAGIRDIILEAATTTILDCEDAVAAVDAEDKVVIYRNLLGVVKGDLQESVAKNGKTFVRRLSKDREYQSVDGEKFTLPGRSLLFVRNVGLLMNNPAILDEDENDIFEGILDAVVTTLIVKRDLENKISSRAGSIYIVKPKLHGPEETAFTNELFNKVEKLLGIAPNTVKIGIMDEERRTSANLKACIAEIPQRLAFINTGFLDRTGDEIHTSMEAGPMIRKGDMKKTPWISAYEINNVQVGLECGMRGVAQIGKGMWAAPDLMADMIAVKGDHLRAGANTAWVPSPTAACLHALHYHQVNIEKTQAEMEKQPFVDVLDDLLTIPVTDQPNWSAEEIQQELDNNAQGILGYVVRWVNQGIGCSKVPDIRNIALMEDRATLRISSQHIASWLRHGITTVPQVMDTLKRMAAVVDEQNADDPTYRKMTDDFEHSPGFRAACDLVFKGLSQPSGYTDPLLQNWRQKAKEQFRCCCCA